MKSCLVVDDSRVIRLVARRILESLNFAVEEAADGRQAMAACQKRMPDVILLDWNMPEMNGIDFLRALRAEGNTTSFGFVTSESTPAMREQAIEAGAAFLLAKPFSADDFQNILAGVV